MLSVAFEWYIVHALSIVQLLFPCGAWNVKFRVCSCGLQRLLRT